MGEPNLDTYELAIMDGALERERWDRFLAFAGPTVRETVEESERMRHDFIRHTQTMLTSDDDRERIASASWVSKHAVEMSYRSAIVRRMYAQFLRVDCPSIVLQKTE